MIYGLGLCAGVGMLEEGARLAFGELGREYKTLCYVERDSYAQACLVARMKEKSLEPALIWDELATFDGRPFRGKVSVLCSGLPCQPYSLAGKRAGNDDHRSWGKDGDSGPLPHALRIIFECRPALALFENVPAWVRSGWFRPFGDELSRLGYTIVEPVFIAASDIGASHERERVFILAYSENARIWGLAAGQWAEGQGTIDPNRRGGPLANTGRTQRGRSADAHRERGQGASDMPGGTGAELAQPASGGLGELRQPSTSAGQLDRGGKKLADTGRQGLQGHSEHGDNCDQPGRQRSGSIGPVGAGGSELLFAPGPSDPRWPEIIERYPHIAPAVKPGLCVQFDDVAMVLDSERADQLRCSGNGVVAAQASLAIALLLKRAGIAHLNPHEKSHDLQSKR